MAAIDFTKRGRMPNKAIVATVLVLSLGAVLTLSGRSAYVDISGHVYDRADSAQGACPERTSVLTVTDVFGIDPRRYGGPTGT